MLKLLRYLVLVLVALALVTFALANRAPVPLHLLPPDLAAFLGVDWTLTLPVWMVALLGIVAGLILGFVIEWLREHRHRAAASSNRRAVKRLERELAVMRDSSGLPEDEVLALVRPGAGAGAGTKAR